MTLLAIEGDFDGLPLLANWLRGDPSVARLDRAVQGRSVDEEAMGAAAEVLHIVLQPGNPLPALAASLATYAVSRQRKFKLVVNGTQVEVSNAKHQDELILDILAELKRGS